MKALSYILSLPARVLITIAFILVIVSLGIGWGVRRASNSPDEQSPTTTVEAIATTVPAYATPAPLAPPTATPIAAAATSTPAPIPQPSPTTAVAGEWATVQSGEGLFMVCRRHCQGRWPPDDDALATYAEAVAELNGLPWPPDLSPGQRLRMPSCPAR
jgi:hypothetical protein